MDRKIGKLTARELMGFVLLGVLVVSGLLASRCLERRFGEAAGTMEECVWLALSGQLENARKTADSAAAHWEQHRTLQAVLGDHTAVEEIDDLFSELKICGISGDGTEFARLCSVLAQKLENLGSSHRLSWANVL